MEGYCCVLVHCDECVNDKKCNECNYGITNKEFNKCEVKNGAMSHFQKLKIN